jgi:hypothetical protein
VQRRGDKSEFCGTANHDSDNVSVLLGNGEGALQAAVNHGVGDGPSSIAVDDFNRDGNPDLSVANRGGNSVSVLLNSTESRRCYLPLIRR